jgi:hypothetical protein
MADKRISQLVDRGTVVNSDVVPIVVSGAVTTNKATISSIQTFMQGNLDLGVTSVGITLGTTGTDVSVSGSPITSSGNITINLPTASATNRGALSSADWITFNSKQGAITLTTTGTSGASTLVGNTLNIPNYTTDLSGYVTLGTAQTITAQKTFTTSGSSDTMIISHGSGSGFALDVIKGGNGEAIRVNKTSGSGNAMTVIGGNFEAPTIVKTGGTSTQYLMADGSVSTLTNPVTGTGTAGRVALWNGTNSINSDSDFTYNSTSNLLTIGGGITLTGAQTIQTSTGNLTIATGGGNGNILLTPNGTGKVGIGTITPEGSGLTVASGGILVSLDPGVDRKVLELNATSTGAKLSSSYVGASSYGSLELLTSNVARLTIADTGAATFANTLGIGITPSGNDGLFQTSGSNGNLGGGTAKRSATIFSTSAENADRPGIILGYDTAGGGIIAAATQSSGQPLNFWTYNGSAWGERMRITSGGNVGIGTTDLTSTTLRIKSTTTGSSNFVLYTEDSSANILFWVRDDGYITTGSRTSSPYNLTSGNAANMVVGADGTLYRSTSSLKYKTDIEDYDKGLAEVMQMRPVYYKSINEREKDLTFAGLIAEEIQELGLTEFVQYAEDGTPDALSYSNMASLLIKAIQELKTEIDSLKNQIK